jgi:hypothetical protein
MQLAHRSQTHVNAQQCPGDLLTAAAGNSVTSCEIHQESRESCAEAGSRMGRNLGPRCSAAFTLDTPQMVFGNVRHDRRNVDHLITEILAQQLTGAGAGLKPTVAVCTRFGKDILDHVGVLWRYHLSVVTLVTRLPSRPTFSRFLGPPGLWLGRRTISRRRLGRIARIFGQLGNLAFQFLDPGTQPQQNLNNDPSVTVSNGNGFFPSHEGSHYHDLKQCQDPMKKPSRYRATNNKVRRLIKSNPSKPGGSR